MRAARLVLLLAGTGFLALACGCSHKSPDNPASLADTEKEIIEAAARNPNYSAQWEGLIRDLTYRYAARLGRYDPDPAMPALAKQAIDQGCREPFVRYLWFQHEVSYTTVPSEDMSREGVAIIDEMHQESYPALMQSYAALRAILVFRRNSLWTETTAESKAEYDRLFSMYHHAVMDALRDPALSERTVRGVAVIFETFWPDPRYSRDEVYANVEKAVRDHFGNCATVHLLRGNEAMLRALDTHGGMYAFNEDENSVAAARKLNTLAEKELNRAWALDPSEPAIAAKMIRVCAALGSPRATMEKWFDRGQSTHSSYSLLYDAKLDYLSDPDLANFEEQLAFGRECCAHPEYGADAALILHRAHFNHVSDKKEPEIERYLAQPEVWADVKLSFSTYFEREPNMVPKRMKFAFLAWVAKDWPTLAEQLALSDPSVTDMRSLADVPMLTDDQGVAMDHAQEQKLEDRLLAEGQAVFDRMMADSKAHAGGT
jgi:hypothetical protein